MKTKSALLLETLLHPSIKKRALFFLVNDFILSFVTFYVAYLLRFNFQIPSNFLNNLVPFFLILVALKLFLLFWFRIYNTPWRFFSLSNFEKIVKAHLISYGLFSLFFLVVQDLLTPFPRSVIVIDLFLSIFFIGSFRISKRLLFENSRKVGEATLIYGAGSTGELAVRHLTHEHNTLFPIAFIDEDPMRKGSVIHDLRVHGFEDIADLIYKHNIKSAIIAQKISAKKLDDVVQRLNNFGITRIQKVQIFEEKIKQLKDISIEDLLARKPKDLDKAAIESFIKDKIVLVTGAGGSIGSEICKKALSYGAKHLIMLDNSEFNLYQIGEKLNADNATMVMLNVSNRAKLDTIFELHKPQIVIHAAAYKHVPLVEANIEAAIENNINGTMNTIDMAIKHEVETFVLISTDKAVRPTNVMGTTKRICELYAGNVENNRTNILAVRFGNVLGSSGSVIPKFRSQIEKGGPITVTHPDITRFFMLIPEACDLVLQAASLGKNRELFILDMGEPIKIVDLAKKMLLLSNHEDINIEFIGLRPGEKLYEELLINDSDKETQYPSIFTTSGTRIDMERFIKNITRLQDPIEDKIAVLKEIVPEFDHQEHKN
jgi:UDP-N-acetylglucosamine 4,6-dehydratase